MIPSESTATPYKVGLHAPFGSGVITHEVDPRLLTFQMPLSPPNEPPLLTVPTTTTSPVDGSTATSFANSLVELLPSSRPFRAAQFVLPAAFRREIWNEERMKFGGVSSLLFW